MRSDPCGEPLAARHQHRTVAGSGGRHSREWHHAPGGLAAHEGRTDLSHDGGQFHHRGIRPRGAESGTITTEGGTTRQLPYSAGGTLNLFASRIQHGGVLRAPTGTINLGWDGSGEGPKDAIMKLAVPSATQLTLAAGSVTSVSSIDPLTGAAVLLPYGINQGTTAWIDPLRHGHHAGESAVEEHQPRRPNGGGADRQHAGCARRRRSLRLPLGAGKWRHARRVDSTTSFAIIPGYAAEHALYAPFNPSTLATSLGGDPGYVNTTLAAGEQVLNGGEGFAAGTYTLLPARYGCCCPARSLAAPSKSGTPGEAIVQPTSRASSPATVSMPRTPAARTHC